MNASFRSLTGRKLFLLGLFKVCCVRWFSSPGGA